MRERETNFIQKKEREKAQMKFMTFCAISNAETEKQTKGKKG